MFIWCVTSIVHQLSSSLPSVWKAITVQNKKGKLITKRKHKRVGSGISHQLNCYFKHWNLLEISPSVHPSSHKSNTVTVLAFLNALWVQVGDFFLPHPFQTEPNSSQLLTEVLTWRKVKSVVEHQQGSDSFPPVVTVTSSGSLLPVGVYLWLWF